MVIFHGELLEITSGYIFCWFSPPHISAFWDAMRRHALPGAERTWLAHQPRRFQAVDGLVAMRLANVGLSQG